MRIADEECTDLVLYAEVDHLPCRLVAKVAHAPLDATCHLVPRPLRFLPTIGILLAACLFPGELPVSHVALALETANPAAGDDKGCPGIGRHSGQVVE
jgi:hypothetical protein